MATPKLTPLDRFDDILSELEVPAAALECFRPDLIRILIACREFGPGTEPTVAYKAERSRFVKAWELPVATLTPDVIVRLERQVQAMPKDDFKLAVELIGDLLGIPEPLAGEAAGF